MDLTAGIPQHIQSTENVLQHQTLPHLPSTLSFPHTHPLSTIPSFTQIEPQIQHLPSHENEHCQFPSNNNEYCSFYDTSQPFNLHNIQNCPFYNTNLPCFSVFSTYSILPTSPPVYHSHNQNTLHNLLSPTLLQKYPYSLPTTKKPSAPSTPITSNKEQSGS